LDPTIGTVTNSSRLLAAESKGHLLLTQVSHSCLSINSMLTCENTSHAQVRINNDNKTAKQMHDHHVSFAAEQTSR